MTLKSLVIFLPPPSVPGRTKLAARHRSDDALDQPLNALPKTSTRARNNDLNHDMNLSMGAPSGCPRYAH